MQLKVRQGGFTLAEIAIAFLIVALLLGGAIMSLSAQFEQRNQDETLRRLNAAAEAVLAYAIVNRRLPCPATAGTTGDEAPAGGNCTTWNGGFLPARTIGFQPTDAAGYGVDVWGNRLRYAVSGTVAPTDCTNPAVTPHFTSAANLKTNGVSCRPNDLDVCASSVGTSATSCNAAPRVASTQTVAFIVFSTGKNGAGGGAAGADENENTDGDRVFVTRTPSGPEAVAGTFDDLMVFVPVGVVYSRLIAAGVLP
ncbi:MAG: pilus assembly FimT family protein [Woeseiaceae bacterium]